MVADARATRASANALFAISDYDGAVAGYERALAALPAYLGYEAALVRANMAACFLKTREWKRAVGEADRGLGALDECEEERARPAVEDVAEEEEEADGGAEVGREVPSEEDVLRMRRKLLLRRAKAGTEMGGWAALQRALEGERRVPLQFSALIDQITLRCRSWRGCLRWIAKRSATPCGICHREWRRRRRARWARSWESSRSWETGS
jgi:tetratricopeptide (TPR) repeat protein